MSATPAYEWYQTADEVVVVIKPNEAIVNIDPPTFNSNSFNLTIHVQSGVSKFSLDLSQEIITDQCRLLTVGNKVEVHLRKQQPTRWTTLEPKTVAPELVDKVEKTKKPKDWDKIAEEAMGDEKNEQDVVQFFQQVYGDLDDDGKRAMMKSMVESCGTVLNTNWEEVGKAPVEVKPPAGVDFKPSSSSS